ncbi:NADP transhydrogenase subunit alpha [Caldanaerobacter subterraneus subsp. yonseiensis KB-1]|uniref:NADP transhydrogenase subunit alpha n=1 Tax=Caldanaerobacter subterraneus subsp. yonseiensis KB-1 TaxID=1388761 RepID=U5CVP5_CALSX|nr:NAD/NADP-dependent octopine/nopaline dehydrogenase family protein [Caldanaerobacter subterraneus]ERM93036.1 NADP transhydrogenase subunit alpha [Caldanaerobacter subterraneus subsp. yonseiensis KB-1]
MKMPYFAVIGAGNGGQAIAGHLALKGFKVNLYNRTYEKLIPIIQRGGIELEGEVEGFGKLNLVTDDIGKAVKDVDMILVAVPASAHAMIAEELLPYLQRGQIVVLNPGRTGGALEVHNIFKKRSDLEVVVAETDTFIYACRSSNGKAKIYKIKDIVSVAAIPKDKTEEVVEILNIAFPQFVAAENVLETSFNNFGAIFHPAPTLLNAARIETTKGNFEYYREGISPSVAKILEKIDNERMMVAKALGVKTISAKRWLKESYNADGDTLYEAIQNTKAYIGLMAPDTVNCRYIFEDVPMSLVPISSIGKEIGVKTPTIDAIIHLASVMHGKDYWEIGRTADKLGIRGMSPKEIIELVEGKRKEVATA